MGRKPVKKTKVEVEAQKRKWADARNRRRRESYKRDPEYRREVNERNRSNYREANDVKLRNCGPNIKRLSKFGQDRLIKSNGRIVNVLTLTTHEIAKALGDYHHIVLYRWHREGKFPKPSHVVEDEGIFVYTGAEAIALLSVMSRHQKKKLYLHNRDKATIKELFAAVKKCLEE